jgi:RimJ/RimL family protein N-acetyltransferase
MNWYLETERLQLRSLIESDLQNLCDLNSDPAVTKYLGKEPSSPDAMAEVVQKVMTRDRGYQNQLGLFITIEKSSGAFIGWFILRPVYDSPHNTDNLEIGWRFKQRFWGKGYGTEGALALKECATKRGARRLYATAMSANAASIRIMNKIGLILERTYVDADDYWGQPTELVEYALHLDQ